MIHHLLRIHPGVIGGASTLTRLFTLAGVGMSIFSFSPSSLGAGLWLTFLPDADIFILACSKAVLDALRFILGVAEVVVGLEDDERASDDVSLAFVSGGVSSEERPCFRGGGPIEPIADLVELFTRLVSVFTPEAPESLPRVLLPASESADGGLTAPGVVNAAAESLRCAIFEELAGVLPAVPLTPSFLLS